MRPRPRTLVEGDLTIPAFHRFEGDLVVTGDLRVGAGVCIEGNVKARGDITLEADARVEGHLFGNRAVFLGRGVSVTGVVMGERRLVVSTGCLLGSATAPTTVSGGRVRLAPGVQIHGTLWALEKGRIGAVESIRPPRASRRRANRLPALRFDRQARPAPPRAAPRPQRKRTR